MSFPLWIIGIAVEVVSAWRQILGREEWEVRVLEHIEDFPQATSNRAPGLALLDWGCLPYPPAQTLRELQSKAGGISWLIASQILGQDVIIDLLEAGAEDHIAHSIHPGLLLAKLRAHRRRLQRPGKSPSDILRAPEGDIKLDSVQREVWVRSRGGKWGAGPDMTAMEIKILELFLERPGITLERRFLLDVLHPSGEDLIESATIDKHVEAVRRKLGKLGARIRTVYGVGYVYRDEGR